MEAVKIIVVANNMILDIIPDEVTVGSKYLLFGFGRFNRVGAQPKLLGHNSN